MMTRREKDCFDALAMRLIPMTGDPETYRNTIGKVAAEFRRIDRKAQNSGYRLGEKHVARNSSEIPNSSPARHSKEWWTRMSQSEGDSEVGVGCCDLASRGHRAGCPGRLEDAPDALEKAPKADMSPACTDFAHELAARVGVWTCGKCGKTLKP